MKKNDKDIINKHPNYVALIERIILNEDNSKGFSIITCDRIHRSIWYAVLNHYGIKYKKIVITNDYVNGFTKDGEGQKHYVSVCDYKTADKVYHWKDFCCSTCDGPDKIIDVSKKQIKVHQYNLAKRDQKSSRLYCTEEERDMEINGNNTYVVITDTTRIVNDKLLDKLHPPRVYRN